MCCRSVRGVSDGVPALPRGGRGVRCRDQRVEALRWVDREERWDGCLHGYMPKLDLTPS